MLYFGGYHNDNGANDMVAEYKNLKWSELGRLASARYAHRSIKMDSKIYIFGGWDTTWVFSENAYAYLEFSNIEIWENLGDLTNPNYNGTLLDNSDDHDFFTYDYGEIIRIDHDQCEFNPW